MTLEQAINSGRKFKRPEFKSYMDEEAWLFVEDDFVLFSNTFCKWCPRLEDIIATDWEVEDFKLSFTFTEISTAIDNVSRNSKSLQDFQENLSLALGFTKKEKISFNKPLSQDEDWF